MDAYAALTTAPESPVLDTSCAALLALSREVRSQGYKVALTGEGADEAFAGYVWCTKGPDRSERGGSSQSSAPPSTSSAITSSL
jgi:asparagine synthetase B (glutamine-hydrolysing)